MSTIYDTEPQPTASVILHTTGGELAVEIFAKQTPLTSRNFLQLCLNGYYDNTIFHRLVPGFVIQGGDPTGTGNGGESIYDGGALAGDLDPWPMDERRGLNAGPQGINFKDEFHSRLKFSRRGLLGMANEGKPDTNGSQFFFTLDKTDELNGKNTMFGRVAGPTIYNLTKMGQVEVHEGTERPLYPIVIKNIEIVTNPFTDMRKQERVARYEERQAAPAEKKKSKRKKGVNKTLLSFGDDIEEDEDEVEVTQGKHKVTKTGKSKRTESRRGDGETQSMTVVGKADPEDQAAENKSALPSRAAPPAATPGFSLEDDASLAELELGSETSPMVKSELDKTNAEIAALKASMRRTVRTEPANIQKTKSVLESLTPANTARGKKLSKSHGLSSHDEKTLKLLGRFESKLEAESASRGKESLPSANQLKDSGDGTGAEEEHGEVCDLHFISNCQSCRPWDRDQEDNGDDDDDDWMIHTLNCEADRLGKDLSNRRKAEDELIVIDPREKAQTLKEEKRATRDARGSDNGRGGRAWDQARHAKMVHASALSGRGAR
ncbi:peptidyl-prolyl cis trans isomerase [Grosmannia clavigera kw1407]|uniref:peptidylprolyl isomerase n=1 Tax=Grosmannia clavigera (strain kw1407 / UAMH 11150) TaxID=655863 RepID=F0XRR7_GROCL|nr:peptidyl-prolyl cis trans isomerase [Grosmannia clavigera kw1407]EFW99570.1 peptidyl-prolyl cis trans isomerase [Grosmannia clavigera kw1407]